MLFPNSSAKPELGTLDRAKKFRKVGICDFTHDNYVGFCFRAGRPMEEKSWGKNLENSGFSHFDH